MERSGSLGRQRSRKKRPPRLLCRNGSLGSGHWDGGLIEVVTAEGDDEIVLPLGGQGEEANCKRLVQLVISDKHPMGHPEVSSVATCSQGLSYTLEDGRTLDILDEVLGRGAFGTVYKGLLHSSSGDSTTVAVKTADRLGHQQSRCALIQESKVLENLKKDPHPNVITYHGCTAKSHGQGPFIVLEYVPWNLDELMDQDHFRTYMQALDVFEGIAGGLEHLHKHNIVHFDLKPANILMTAELVPRIADFGVSKLREKTSITTSPKGAIMFMAPELLAVLTLPDMIYDEMIQKVSRVTDSVDIYSFGMLIFFCLTGRQMCSGMGGKDMAQHKPQSEDEDAGHVINIGNFLPGSVNCDCPKELCVLISDCLKFDLDALETKLHGRPSAFEIKQRLGKMKGCSWANDCLPWKRQTG